MATFPALLIGGGLILMAVVVMYARGVATTARLIAVLLVALVTSSGSALYATSRHSGTGNLVSRGYPRPFHFQWRDFEGRGIVKRDVNVIYYGANSIVHFGVASLIAALLPRRRRGPEVTRMAGSMFIVRLAVGVVLLILAVIGGFIPILQGWIFFLLAILVLFPKARFTEKILRKAEPKVPRTVSFLRRMGIGTEDTPAGGMQS